MSMKCSSSLCPCLKGLSSEIVSSDVDIFYVQLRLFETWVFIGPASFLQEPGLCFMLLLFCSVLFCVLLHPLSAPLAEDGRKLVPLFMLCCALGIHVDESGSPEERQSGDGTSFPESPDLSHVGTTAVHHLANQLMVNLMLFALRVLSDITSF